MDIFYYKQKHPEHILVYIEEVNLSKGIVIFDFIDLGEYLSFLSLVGTVADLDEPSMIVLDNYRGKRVLENTVYAIVPETIGSWIAQGLLNHYRNDSYLVGYRVNLQKTNDKVFDSSVTVSIGEKIDQRTKYYDISLNCTKNVTVKVRDVKQGSWNEVCSKDGVLVVFDAGTCTNASKSDIKQLIDSRAETYELSKPILILSHWDKDHYHCLLGMSKSQLATYFRSFVCRDALPNITSQNLFNKITSALGNAKVFSIPAFQKSKRRNISPKFISITDRAAQVVLYNAEQSKNRNISGLAISVKTANNAMILSGDALYEQLSRDILVELNFQHTHHLLVPHHGGEAGVFKYAKPIKISFANAIVSVGKNPHGHPSEKNIESLRTAGFHVRQTNIEKEDIVIEL